MRLRILPAHRISYVMTVRIVTTAADPTIMILVLARRINRQLLRPNPQPLRRLQESRVSVPGAEPIEHVAA